MHEHISGKAVVATVTSDSAQKEADLSTKDQISRSVSSPSAGNGDSRSERQEQAQPCDLWARTLFPSVKIAELSPEGTESQFASRSERIGRGTVDWEPGEGCEQGGGCGNAGNE